jgi:hypothetical protein
MQTIPAFAGQMKKHIAELNLFKDGASRSDPFHLRTAIISTRVYIVLLAVSLITLVVFISLGTQSEVITILNPSAVASLFNTVILLRRLLNITLYVRAFSFPMIGSIIFSVPTSRVYIKLIFVHSLVVIFNYLLPSVRMPIDQYTMHSTTFTRKLFSLRMFFY